MPALAARALRAWRSCGGGGGRALSIVVAGDAGRDALAETIASARAVDGAEVVLAPGPDVLAAADAGVGRATRDLVLVVRAGDLVRPRAVVSAVAELGAGTVAWAAPADRGWRASWLSGGRPGGPVTDLAPWAVVVRRDAWRPVAGGSSTWSTAVLEVLLASEPVVLEDAFVERRGGAGRGAQAANPSALPTLPETVAALGEVTRRVADTPFEDAWADHLAEVVVPRLLDETERATDEQWASLRDLARALDPHRASALPRALLTLAIDDRRDDLVLLATDAWAQGHTFAAEVDGADLVATWTVALPRDTRVLTQEESPLRAQLHRRTADRAEVHLGIPHVVLERPVTLTVHGTVLSPRPDPAATRWLADPFATGLSVSLPMTAAETTLPLRLQVDDVVREATLVVPPAPARPTGTVITAIRLEDDHLVVHHTGDGTALRLVADHGTWPEPERRAGVVRWRLVHRRWGRTQLVPSGHHRLLVGDSPAQAAPGVLPLDDLAGSHRLTGWRGPHGGLVLRLAPPLTDDELGPRAQRLLRDTYARDPRPVDPDLWWFESFAGAAATDNPLAIHDELRRRRPGLRAVWSVSDVGQWVPEGVLPLVRHSAAWYDALARAGTLVVSTELDEYFVRRPGQLVVQCFHGYPSKAMGRDQWAALDLMPREIAMLRRRGADTWSVILTPTPEMTDVYRQQYAYSGPALEHGYPRDDALVRADDDDRRRVREQLGIGDRFAVLHAPTWREHLALRPRLAESADLLDVAELARLLGPDHVVLHRGHRFHRPGAEVPGVIDVTDHPEINDLIIASDAAVLDYSSLRFDYALVDRPMVFLVPDLEDYAAGTRAFITPFTETAPGPLVTSTAEVAAALAEPARLAERWAEARSAFRATYQPWQDGQAASRVVDGLLRLREEPDAG